MPDFGRASSFLGISDSSSVLEHMKLAGTGVEETGVADRIAPT